jgi:hypothetical protein
MGRSPVLQIAWLVLAGSLVLPCLISASAAQIITWGPSIFFLVFFSVLLWACGSGNRDNQEDVLMAALTGLAFGTGYLYSELAAKGSHVLPWVTGWLLIAFAIQTLSIFEFSILKKTKNSSQWMLPVFSRIYERLLNSRLLALWGVYLAIVTASLGFPGWTPTWPGDRPIMLGLVVLLALYGQQRARRERQSLEDVIRSAARDSQAEARENQSIAGEIQAEARENQSIAGEIQAEAREIESISEEIESISGEIQAIQSAIGNAQRIASPREKDAITKIRKHRARPGIVKARRKYRLSG